MRLQAETQSQHAVIQKKLYIRNETEDNFNKRQDFPGLLIDGKYLTLKFLDGGAYGKVYQGRNILTNQKVAIKIIQTKKFPPQRKNLLQGESDNLKKLNSKNILKLYAAYENDYTKILVTEFCGKQNLRKYMNEKSISEKEAIEFLKQMMMGLAQMHSKRIMHRDVKLENMMIYKGVIKIIDFGFSKQLDTEQLSNHTILGTKSTKAPQVLLKKKYGLKADIWSLGVILYTMLLKKPPYQIENKDEETYKNIMKTDIIPKNMQAERKLKHSTVQLLRSMLQINHAERISWKQLAYFLLGLTNQTIHKSFVCRTEKSALESISQIEDIEQPILSEQQLPRQPPTEIAQARYLPRDQLNSKTCEITDFGKEELKATKMFQKSKISAFVLETVIIPLKDLLDLSSRKDLELLYLLIVRCYNNLKYCRLEYEKRSEERSRIGNKAFTDLQNIAVSMQAQVQKYHHQYQQRLIQCENSIFETLTAYFEEENEKQERKLFLKGHQANDYVSPTLQPAYKATQQIQFTFQHYIKPLLQTIKDNESRKQKYAEVYLYLKYYRQIYMIQYDESKEIIEQVSEIIDRK